ncbi:MAG: response regulator transcription factor [Allobranchiibius sp.]
MATSSNRSASATGARAPITIALVDDYDVVLQGVARIIDQYRDRVIVAEMDTNEPLHDTVDIVLYDAFAQPESDEEEIAVLVRSPHAQKVVVYTWNFHPDLVANARRQGVHGYLSKAMPARDFIDALEAVHAGQIVISTPPGAARAVTGLDWPGRSEGLTDRESEILALITQGKSNPEIAALTYLSPNTVKSYSRTIYRKINVSSRIQAALWGIDHGFSPDHHRIDHWRGGP